MELLARDEFQQRIEAAELFSLPNHLAKKKSTRGDRIYFMLTQYADGSEVRFYAYERLNEK